MNERAYYSISNRVTSAIGLCVLTLVLGCNPMAADTPDDMDNALINENLNGAEVLENSNDGEPNAPMEIPSDDQENSNGNIDDLPDDSSSDNMGEANDNATNHDDNISSNDNHQLNDNQDDQPANDNSGPVNENAPPSGGNPNPSGGGPTNDNDELPPDNANSNEGDPTNDNGELPFGNANSNEAGPTNDNVGIPTDNTNSNTGDNINDNGGSGGPPCIGEGDCEVGFNCTNGYCTATTAPDIELGDLIPFVKTVENGAMIVHQGFQGGYHIFMSIRGVGFSPNATVQFSRSVVPDGTNTPIVVPNTVTQFFVEDGNEWQILNQVLVFIDGVLPPDYDGRGATVTLTVAEMGNPSVSATLAQHVTLMAEQ